MLLALLVASASLGAGAEEYCYTQDTAPYSLFASKTAYETVRNRRVRAANVPNCSPVLVWGLFRHGTRYPREPEIKQQRDLQNLRDNVLHNHNVAPHSGELCYGDLDLLRDWTYNVTDADAEMLTSSGVNELYLLAKRLKSDFPLLDATYTEDRFKIRFSQKIRTKTSAEAFSLGLFGEKIDFPSHFADESLLEPSNNCTNWKTSTSSEGAEKQIRSFRSGPLMRSLVTSVSRRLGFRYDLTYDAIEDIYNMCRFDKAWYPKSQHAAWCAAFTREHLQLLEYGEDLDYYYRSGYGNPFTTKLGCPLVADLINTINSRVQANYSEDVGPSVVLYFSHSLTLRALLVRLGMAHDLQPVTADNYPSMERRQWRSSYISPFAGNLIAVLYKCGDQFKVMFYLDEQFVDYKGCQVGLCDWSYIYERFAPMVDPSTCNLNFCDTSAGTALRSWAPLLPLVAFLLARLHSA